MTKDKHLKRRIRERMRKTGESYTTARLQLLEAQPSPAVPAEPRRAPGRVRFRTVRLTTHSRRPLGLQYMAPAFAIVISLAIGVVGFLTLTTTRAEHNEDQRIFTEVQA